MARRPDDDQEPLDPELVRRLQEAAADLEPSDSVFFFHDGTLWEVEHPDDELDREHREHRERLERLQAVRVATPVRRRRRGPG